MKGIVAAVLSGDTLAVRILDMKQTPVHAVMLEYIQSPRIGSIDGRVPDEPGAWPAFDYLRHLCIGKRVILENLRTPDNMNKRSNPVFGPLPVSFARVKLFDSDKLDVALSVVENGWANIRSKNEESDDDYLISLINARDAAKEDKRGIFAENNLVRKLPADYNPKKLIEKKEFDAIIENVISGSMLNVWLLPNFEMIRLQLGGIRTPSAKRDSPEPFGIEAKDFVEKKILQRDVKVQLLSFTEKQFFVGRVIHPNGDIAVFLLAEGLGQMNNATAAMVSNSGELREAESRAKQSRKNLWKDFDVKTLQSIQFDGRVVLIRNSSILDVESGLETRKIYLSGCRVPQFNSNGKRDPFGLEAREFLRRMLIGRQVQCSIDYTIEDRSYATVYVGNKCVNEQLAAEGLCNVFVSRNQKASDRIDDMMHAEQEAKQKKKGIHSLTNRPQGGLSINDLSNNHSRQRSVPFLHYIEKKTSKGIIEHFVSATRIVVLIPESHCLIRINLQGLVSSDPQNRIGYEALEYCKSNFLQRDVDVQVFDVDKVGLFIGNVRLTSGPSLEAEILRHGFSEIHTNSIRNVPYRKELEDAQKEAEESQLGVFSSSYRGYKILENGHTYEVNITEIWDPVTVVIQIQSDELKKINELLTQSHETLSKVMKGDLVAVIYDDKIYRGKVNDIVGEDKFDVNFLEFDSNETVSIDMLRSLPSQLLLIPPQAQTVRLAGLKAFNFDEEFNKDAMNFMWKNCENATLYAHVVTLDDDYPNVVITDSPEPTSGSLNTQLLSLGYVRTYLYDAEPPFDQIFDEFEETENAAKADKKGAWINGNIGDDSDDEQY